MVKKIIQVPIDEALLKDLNALSRSKRQTRSAFIREACAHYIVQTREETLDSIYRRGYTEFPEEPEIGESQLKSAGEILPGESW